MDSVVLFDSTLRDGAQGENISFSAEDKCKIAQALGQLGISYIEAGNPGSNPKDAEFFRRAEQLELGGACLVAFGSTHRKGVCPEKDENLNALISAGTQSVAIFGKSSVLHVDQILHASREENLSMIFSSVVFCKQAGKEVHFDAEHFFDGYALDPEYALSTLDAAQEAGADWIVLCDTNGGTQPEQIRQVTQEVIARMRIPVGIHCHNDCGLAVANSLEAVKAGARQVQGTLLGFGERCGNTNLSTMIGILQAKMGISCIPSERLCQLTSTAGYIAEVANLVPDNTMPFVGKSAFAHKGGMHVDGVNKNPATFEHMLPETVGNSRTFLLSEQSGRGALLAKLSRVFPHLSKDSEELLQLSTKLKEKEQEGYVFEAATASFELLARRLLGKETSFFEVLFFRILGEQDSGETLSTAMVKIRVGNQTAITADEGKGPVNAMDKALRKAVQEFYPSLGSLRLIDYKVRVITPEDATAARVRVLIETTDGMDIWTTVGVNVDIIHASMDALVDSIAYKLLKDQHKGKEL